MNCPKCGNLLNGNEKFCPKCGSKFEIDRNGNLIVKKSVFKRYLKSLLFLILYYFIISIVDIICTMSGIESDTLNHIFSIIKILLPILWIEFGWLVIMIYDSIKRG